jgi:hypothetical protein
MSFSIANSRDTSQRSTKEVFSSYFSHFYSNYSIFFNLILIQKTNTQTNYFQIRRFCFRYTKKKLQDFLKTKIEQRPDRESLIQKNILSDSKAAPSLQEHQRKLKKARLADDLNDKLLNRPGPLELVEYGILVSDTSLTEAIKGEQQLHCFSSSSRISPLFVQFDCSTIGKREEKKQQPSTIRNLVLIKQRERKNKIGKLINR